MENVENKKVLLPLIGASIPRDAISSYRVELQRNLSNPTFDLVKDSETGELRAALVCRANTIANIFAVLDDPAAETTVASFPGPMPMLSVEGVSSPLSSDTSDDEPEEEVDLSEMDDDDLRQFAEDRSLDVDGIKKLKGKKLQAAVQEAYDASQEEDNANDGADGGPASIEQPGQRLLFVHAMPIGETQTFITDFRRAMKSYYMKRKDQYKKAKQKLEVVLEAAKILSQTTINVQEALEKHEAAMAAERAGSLAAMQVQGQAEEFENVEVMMGESKITITIDWLIRYSKNVTYLQKVAVLVAEKDYSGSEFIHPSQGFGNDNIANMHSDALKAFENFLDGKASARAKPKAVEGGKASKSKDAGNGESQQKKAS